MVCYAAEKKRDNILHTFLHKKYTNNNKIAMTI